MVTRTAHNDENNRGYALSRWWMIATNGIMALAWGRVVWILAYHYYYDGMWTNHNNSNSTWCTIEVIPAVRIALMVSFLELFNAVTGVTRSPPAQVLLFAVVRFGVEIIVAPQLESCQAWPHILTVTCWSVGDAIRFGCFWLDSVMVDASRSSSSRRDIAKAIRYTVGPILFPVGAAGEMIMVLAAAQQKQGRAKLWTLVAASLWPLGFYPLFTQLLKQRRKFFAQEKVKST